MVSNIFLKFEVWGLINGPRLAARGFGGQALRASPPTRGATQGVRLAQAWHHRNDTVKGETDTTRLGCWKSSN